MATSLRVDCTGKLAKSSTAEQNRGAGSALLDKAKELRPDELYLWVFQKNPCPAQLQAPTDSRW